MSARPVRPPAYIEAEIEPGGYVVMKKGGTEAAVNVGSKRYFEYLIELKDRP